jgi:site-specific DNA-adenine methylase
MIDRPFFKYAGSKWLLSKHYPAPRHDVIIEPFAGSACYGTRHHERQVVLVDLNPDVVEIWRYLQRTNPHDIARLPADELREGDDLRNLSIPQGAKLLIRAWQRVGTSTCWTVSAWNNKPGQWSARTRDHVAANVEKIKHWMIWWADYRSILRDQTATWFFDPPYQGLPLYGSKSMDYIALAHEIQACRGQVIVCEQAKATWLPFRPFRATATGRRGTNKDGSVRAPTREGIWTHDG